MSRCQKREADIYRKGAKESECVGSLGPCGQPRVFWWSFEWYSIPERLHRFGTKLEQQKNPAPLAMNIRSTG